MKFETLPSTRATSTLTRPASTDAAVSPHVVQPPLPTQATPRLNPVDPESFSLPSDVVKLDVIETPAAAKEAAAVEDRFEAGPSATMAAQAPVNTAPGATLGTGVFDPFADDEEDDAIDGFEQLEAKGRAAVFGGAVSTLAQHGQAKLSTNPGPKPWLAEPTRAGDWSFTSKLAESNYNAVYLGTTETAEGEVSEGVVKAAHGCGAAQQELRVEGEVLGQLADNPHVVNLVDQGVLPKEVGGSPFIVTEKLGDSLEARALDHGALTAEDAARVLDDMGIALDDAKERGIVHRDLKPANVLYADDGSTKIIDWGKAITPEHPEPDDDMVHGTQGFLSPEQIRAGNSDHRTDVWGTSATIYRATTRAFPFPVTGFEDKAAFRQAMLLPLNGQIRQPSKMNPALTPQHDAVMAIGFAKNQDERFQSVGELRDAWHAANRGELPQELSRRASELLARHPWRAID